MDDRFYITGGTLPLDADSYVTRRADTELFEYLRRGEFCYVLNTRQVGKSSLMVRVAEALRAEGVRVVLLDPTAIGVNVTVEEWYDGLLTIIAEQLSLRRELEDFWVDHPRLGPMQRWMQGLEHVALAGSPEPLCIFVDEIDSVQSLPFSADEFFGGIRECYNRRAYNPAFRRLTFCLLGVAAPVDLIADPRITPFNIGRRIELTDFTPEEAAPLENGLNHGGGKGERGRGVQNPNSSFILHPSSFASPLNRILYWTGGHPYLTQKLCSALAQRQGVPTNADVDAVCEELFLSRRAQKTDDNLVFARSRLLYEEINRAALLDMYVGILDGRKIRDDATNPLHSVLRLSGIAQAEDGLLTVRNRIYAHVFNKQWARDNMPGEELRRQKRAYRLGVLRTAFVAALLLMVIAGFGARAYFAEQNARTFAKAARTSEKAAQTAQELAQKEAENSNRLLYATHINLLQRAYQDDDIGRARDLLAETAGSPYRGFEWNYWNRLLKRERLAIPFAEPQSLLVWSRDGRWIVTQTQSTLATPQISFWNARTGKHVRTLAGRADTLLGVASPIAANCVALVDAPQGKTGTVRLVNPTTGETRHVLPVRAGGATLSGDGRRVFTLEPQSDNHTLFKAWDVERGTLLLTTTVSGVQLFGAWTQTPTIQSTRDSRLLCFGSAITRENSPFTLLNTQTGERQWTPPGAYNRYALSPTGRFLVATEQDGFAAGAFQLWDLQAKRQVATLRGKQANAPSRPAPASYMLFTLGFSPNERWIVGAGEDTAFNGCVWIWERATGREKRVLTGQRRTWEAKFSSDGRVLFSASRDNRLFTWNTATWQKTGVYSNDGTNSPVLSPDGNEFLTVDHRAALSYPLQAHRMADKLEIAPSLKASVIRYQGFQRDERHLRFVAQIRPGDNRQHRIYDMQTGMQHLLPFDHTASAITVGNDAYTAAAKNFEKETWVEIRDGFTGKFIRLLHDPLPYWWIRADGPWWAAILYEGKISSMRESAFAGLGKHHPQAVLWNVETGKEVVRLANLQYTPWQVWPKCGTRKLILVDTENVAHFWNVSPLREIFQVPMGSETQIKLESFSVSPNGKYVSVLIAENHFDGRVEIYDFETGQLCAQDEHAFYYQPSNAFSPDGKVRVWVDTQQNAHLMEGATGKEVGLLKSIGGDFSYLAFSPDGTRIATGTTVGTLKLWDVRTGAELMVVRLPGELGPLSFSPDGTHLGVNAWTSGKIRAFVWEAPLPAAVKNQ